MDVGLSLPPPHCRFQHYIKKMRMGTFLKLDVLQVIVRRFAVNMLPFLTDTTCGCGSNGVESLLGWRSCLTNTVSPTCTLGVVVCNMGVLDHPKKLEKILGCGVKHIFL